MLRQLLKPSCEKIVYKLFISIYSRLSENKPTYPCSLFILLRFISNIHRIHFCSFGSSFSIVMIQNLEHCDKDPNKAYKATFKPKLLRGNVLFEAQILRIYHLERKKLYHLERKGKN